MIVRDVLFDCDGVILNSNAVKTTAFAAALEPYGRDVVAEFLSYHKANGGISRFVKFQYLFTDILKTAVDPTALSRLLNDFERAVLRGLAKCDVTPNLTKLRARFPHAQWSIVSGGAQEELQKTFIDRGLDNLFDGGIFGSPRTKIEIITRLVDRGLDPQTSVFLGDAKYDHYVAKHFGIPFIFVTDWSEFDDWQSYTRQNTIPFIDRVENMTDVLPKLVPA